MNRRPSLAPGPTAVVAAGSNLGDSAEFIRRAFDLLEPFAEGPLLRSSLWRSTPVDCPPDSPEFMNAVAALRPRARLSAESLLAELQRIEREFGRTPKRMRNAPRPLDLDLIDFRGERRDTRTLLLPHPRAHLRRFVLAPLAEIAPDYILPGQRLSAARLLASLESDEAVHRVVPRPA